jgi:glycine/D-amino acid oxidase-like deaminating enzyme
MPNAKPSPHHWGTPPWVIDFSPPPQPLPHQADFVIVGAGFTGLAAAAWLRLLDPTKSVVVLEAGAIGHGASGRTGGMALAETAAGDLPGLGDVLGGVKKIFSTLQVGCDLHMPGAWELGRENGRKDSPIVWKDSGTLRVTGEVPGGTLDPGKLVSGMARAAHERGAKIFEHHAALEAKWAERPSLVVSRGAHGGDAEIFPGKILFATNGLSLKLSGLGKDAYPKLTLATLTAPLTEEQLGELGLNENRPFYTEKSFPYLWGRTRPDRSIVWGAGLVDPPGSHNLEEISIESKQPAEMFASFERRVRGLHPVTADIEFTHHWGGPILFRENWEPVFDRHPQSENALVIGAFAGHGVALSSYLGVWAAEILLGRRELPSWGKL